MASNRFNNVIKKTFHLIFLIKELSSPNHEIFIYTKYDTYCDYNCNKINIISLRCNHPMTVAQMSPEFLANQLTFHVKHFPRIKSGDTCIGFPRHAVLPSFSTRNVVVLCPHYKATPATAGIGRQERDWGQGRGCSPLRLSIIIRSNYSHMFVPKMSN